MPHSAIQLQHFNTELSLIGIAVCAGDYSVFKEELKKWEKDH